MAQWHGLPLEIRSGILQYLCYSIIFDFNEYHLKFRNKDKRFNIVWKECYPRPLINYTDALLTCREFYSTITTQIRTFGESVPLTLQTQQYNMVVKFSIRLEELGSHDYREMPLMQAMFGCFWKNWMICETYEIFDILFGGFQKSSRLILVCLLQSVLNKFKRRSIYRSPDIELRMRNRDGFYSDLVFSAGSYCVEGDSMIFTTVARCKYASIKERNSNIANERFDDGVNDPMSEGLANGNESETEMPDISTSKPETWWLGMYIKDAWWREWYLVNYEEERIIVGPVGKVMEWPHHFDLKSLHLWQDGERFCDDCLRSRRIYSIQTANTVADDMIHRPINLTFKYRRRPQTLSFF